MDYILQLIQKLHLLVWNPLSIVLLLGSGVYFSLKFKFVQLRLFPDMLSLLVHNKLKKRGNITFFTFAESLAGRVGTGNIGGVAVAIAYGGPGAVVWMSIFAFFGTTLTFIETCLAHIYKENNPKNSNQNIGGTAYYIESAFKNKRFARYYSLVFAFTLIITSSLFRPEIQAHAISFSVHKAFGINPYYVGIFLSFLLMLCVWTKFKEIRQIFSSAVPIFTLLYLLLTFYALVTHFKVFPEYLRLIFSSAFNLKTVTGGFLGTTISWGVIRGVFSNEAGTGTTTYASSQYQRDHPIKPALEQSFMVFIDTIVVCTATSFLLIATNSYNIIDLSTHQEIFTQLPNISPGSEYVQIGLGKIISPYLAYKLIAVLIFFFSFSTLIAFVTQIEANIRFISSRLGSAKFLSVLYKCLFLLSIFTGIYLPTDKVWMAGDIGIGILAILNTISIVSLYKPVVSQLQDYELRRRYVD